MPVIACTRRKAQPCFSTYVNKAGEREMHLYPTREKGSRIAGGREQEQKAADNTCARKKARHALKRKRRRPDSNYTGYWL